MIAAVIPACNEEAGIVHVLDNLAHLFTLDVVIPVLNGCTDCTRQMVLNHPLASRLALIEYPLPLGIDVPRSWGADCALKLGADQILFVDGDLQGEFSACLQDLLCAVAYKDCDLALTNCYPYIGYRSETAKAVLFYREQLNRKLGLFSSIRPSHAFPRPPLSVPPFIRNDRHRLPVYTAADAGQSCRSRTENCRGGPFIQ